MNALLQLHQGLAAALQADPLHQLALLIVTLDPLWQADLEELYEQEDGLALGLFIARAVFPEVYGEAVLLRHAGASDACLEAVLCQGFARCGIPVDDLTWLGHGIPLNAVGVVLDDPDLYTHHPELLPIVAAFGIHPDAEAYSVDVPDVAYTAGRLLADSLMKQSDGCWRQVGWLIAWLFGCSGNSLIDLDDEALMELQPLAWTPEDVAFAVDMIAEAERIMTDVQAGRQRLETQPGLLADLAGNIRRVYHKLSQSTEQGRKTDEPRIRLDWRPAGDRAE